jgi:hypothetical protein
MRSCFRYARGSQSRIAVGVAVVAGLVALFGALAPKAYSLPTGTCSASAVDCMRSITEQHSPFTNTAAPTWLPRFRTPIANQYIFVDAGSYFMVQVNDRSFNTLLSVKSAIALARECGSKVCTSKWSLTTYRSVGGLQYEIGVPRKSGISQTQLLRIARSLAPVTDY